MHRNHLRNFDSTASAVNNPERIGGNLATRKYASPFPRHTWLHRVSSTFHVHSENPEAKFNEPTQLTRAAAEKLTLRSPLFNTATNPHWRDAVTEAWAYLTRNYEIQGGNQCLTTIGLQYVPDAPALQLRRIAQAIIHFEPVLDLFMPDRAGSEVVRRRNWRDNPMLGQDNTTQAEAIDLIQDIRTTVVGGHGSPESLLSSIMGYDTICTQRRYIWYLAHNHLMDLITFSKPVVCDTAEDAIRWTGLILSFVQAALACPSPAHLQRIAMTRCGLQYFLSNNQGATRRRLIRWVWWHVDIASGQPVVRMN
jgi:hypothetical protein